MKTGFKKLALYCLIAASASAYAQEIGGKLVLYTSQPPEIAQQTVTEFNKKYPKVQVQWTRNGTSQLMNILRTEMRSGAVNADVLLVADDINLGILKQEGKLLAYADADVSALKKEFYDKDKTFFGTKIITTVVGYNSKRAQPVTSWLELTKLENKRQIALPSPLYSGAALYNLHTFINMPELGWEFFNKLAQNQILPEGGNGPALKAVESGLKKYGLITDAMVLRSKKQGSPVDFSYPKEGVSFITEPVAILANSKNIAASKAFVDFLLSEDGQKLVAQQGDRPINVKVAAPAGFPDINTVKLIPLNVAAAIKNNQAALDKFVDIFDEK